ncbi:MAG TPA: HPr(Ser) kinase/phosphatase [Clostridiales bacterium]|nr:HPr(Ser) kinase/phosphatase [Clostridiales bacterium]
MLGRYNTAKEERQDASAVCAADFAAALGLKAVVLEQNAELHFSTSAVCRPGLFLAGYEEFFAASRVVVFGSAEMSFAMSLDAALLSKRIDKLFSLGIPCAVIARNIKPLPAFIAAAEKYKVPLFTSSRITGQIGSAITDYINDLLAEEITMHGVLVDVAGTGVLLTGVSGIGKSEVALELVHRGHRLVADDSVIIRKKNGVLIGRAPDMIRHMLEIRGVGIINVERLFGSVAVRVNKSVDAVFELVAWEEGKTYERIGSESLTQEILGVSLPKLEIPVKAGRNLFVVIEAAVASLRLKEMGYSAPSELEERLKKANDR